jgi:hypothetical protein
VEQLGAGGRTEGIEAFMESAFELVGAHGRARTDLQTHALPASPSPGAHEVSAATALTSTSAPGTASPATRTPTTGGAAPASSAAATG